MNPQDNFERSEEEDDNDSDDGNDEDMNGTALI